MKSKNITKYVGTQPCPGHKQNYALQFWIGHLRFLLPLAVAFFSLCFGGREALGVGASTPFIPYEAELGQRGGGAAVVSLTAPPTTKFSSPQLEASGHSYVHLSGNGQYVTWTNNTGQNITALNIRYSIPDSSGGGGISSTINLYVGGAFRGSINVNSQQTWVYETSSDYNGMSQTPSYGNAHVFWDETRFFVPGGAIPAGSTITLQKDSGNTAAYYDIDVVELEAPPAALAQPANSLSIASYGAQANNANFDNTSAIQNCVNAAQSQGKSVWVPAGTFYMNNGTAISTSGITVQGAGPWYSRIYDIGTPHGWVFLSTSTSFKNLCIDASQTKSQLTNMNAVLAYGQNWTLDNVWASHTMLAWGTGDNILVKNCRVNNSYGDGLNINNSNGTSCTNITISNNFVRGCGDDSIAINSSNPSAPIVTQATITGNTTVASWWAGEISVYGGNSISILNNLVCDSVKQNGILIDTYSNGSPLNGVTVDGNTVLRCGSYGYAEFQPAIKIKGGHSEDNVTVSDNYVANSMFSAFEIGRVVNNLVLRDNIIQFPGTTGVQIDSDASGTASIIDTIVANVAAGQSMYANSSSSLSVVAINNSWQPSASPPVNGEIVQLVCATSLMALDDAGGSTTAGNVLHQWTSTLGNTNQEWKLVDVGGGYFNLVCQTSGMALDNSNSTTAGTNVVQWPVTSGSINQYWRFVDAGGGWYNLICQKSGMALDNGGFINPGTNITQWPATSNNLNQYWRLQVVPKNGSVYHMISAKSGKAMDNGGSAVDGGSITQWSDQSGNNHQEWKPVDVGSGYNNLICQMSGKTLDNSGSSSDGTLMKQWAVGSGNQNQHWKFISVGGGYYNVVCRVGGKTLDNGNSTANGAAVMQWTVGADNVNQQWLLKFVR